MSLLMENDKGAESKDKSVNMSDNQKNMVKCKKIGNYVLGKS